MRGEAEWGHRLQGSNEAELIAAGVCVCVCWPFSQTLKCAPVSVFELCLCFVHKNENVRKLWWFAF